jgi:hypothetical protein
MVLHSSCFFLLLVTRFQLAGSAAVVVSMLSVIGLRLIHQLCISTAVLLVVCSALNNMGLKICPLVQLDRLWRRARSARRVESYVFVTCILKTLHQGDWSGECQVQQAMKNWSGFA